MISEKPINIIRKKDINSIGQDLIQIRRELKENNKNLSLLPDQILRILLLSYLYIDIFGCKRAEDDCKSVPFTFSKMCYLMDSRATSNWVEQYLMMSREMIDKIEYGHTLKNILSTAEVAKFPELLPYALEILEYSENDLDHALQDRHAGIVTIKKKESGIYYTPPDLANYMIHRCMKRMQSNGLSICSSRFVDFSCGSGVFLLQLLIKVIDEKLINCSDEYLSFVDNSVFGIDISNQAVECARYEIISLCIRKYNKEKIDLSLLINSVTHNIICHDATKFHTYLEANADYPHTFECIIGNPPYVGTTNLQVHSSTSIQGNLCIPFVYNLMNYSSPNAECALVLPLAVSYNGQQGYRELREAIQADHAEWAIEHYDRSPDSLFGDDVKARGCIAFRSNGKERNKILSSGLTRWTSESRIQMFSTERPLVEISSLSISEFIPKLSTEIEKNSYSKILSYGKEPKPVIRLPAHKSSKVIVKGTAYNWICAYDHIPEGFDKNGNPFVSKELKTIIKPSIKEEYFLLAVLNSRIAFWLWTVVGDGFHVTNRLLDLLDFNLSLFEDEGYNLANLGYEFSTKIKDFSSYSVNSGKIITNYNHLNLLRLIDKIDSSLSTALHLPVEFPDYLISWYENIIFCSRNSISQVSMPDWRIK
jgi:hypothetical protein